MIQRMQSIWLLLAAIAGFLTLNFAFYSGTLAATNELVQLTAKANTLILILTVATAVLSLVTIFLYKNRKLQLKLTLVGLLLSILTLVLYFKQTNLYSKGDFTLWSVFSFVIPVFLILAAKGLYKDEKLIKSLDRLR